MSIETFVLPALGEKIAKAQVVRILVKVGDDVAKDQPVIEVETDKAAIEVPVDRAGRIVKILVEENEEIAVGAAVIEIETASVEMKAAPQTPKPDKPAAPPPPAAPTVPKKVAPEKAESKEAVRVPASTPVAPSATVAPLTSVTASPDAVSPGHASPSIRKMARELGVDLVRITPTGAHARITADDVRASVRAVIGGTTDSGPAVSTSDSASTLADPAASRAAETREPMSRIRRLTAEHMTRCWSEIPHVTHFDRADITEIEELRQRFAKRVEAAGGKLSVTAILVKITAAALKVFPKFNASVAMESKEIVLHRRINIGVAVDTDRGLLVPVIRDADEKSIVQIASELAALAEAARTKRIAPDALAGGTFTITNLGGIGGTNFTPIVNAPEVAILGVARGSLEPVFNGTVCQPRTILPLALSYDHRLIDGADGARFLHWIIEALQQPFLLSLEVS